MTKRQSFAVADLRRTERARAFRRNTAAMFAEMLLIAAIAIASCAIAASLAPQGAPQSVLAALIAHL